MNTHRDTKGQFKANMSDRERLTPEQLAERRAAHARLVREAQSSISEACDRLTVQQQQGSRVEVKRGDLQSKHETRMAKMRERAGY